jgi:hypothetical protein
VNCSIPNIYLFQRNGIFVFIAQCPMFVSKLWLDLLFRVFVQRLTLVKKTNSFSINHRFIWSSVTIDNSNYFPIGLSIIGHESLKFGLGTPLFAMALFRFYKLSIHVFKLHITYCNCHYLIIEIIIHMASECRLTLNMLYMIQVVWRSPPGCIYLTKS